jgi:radical SAM superfamily enzyme YgiQ (UPF0313 family)
MRVLLVNPPIYDFTAFDYWLRPYGMLRVAGRMQHDCDLTFFDFLTSSRRDSWGRGRFYEQLVPKPEIFRDIVRHFRRFGRPREEFREYLKTRRFDVALIQTGMTYWYLGISEVIEELRASAPGAKIILGGVYASLCPEHAHNLGADLVVRGNTLEPLWRMLPSTPTGLPYHDAAMGTVAAMKLTDGCPFHCTYCSVPLLYPNFKARSAEECLQEARALVRAGVQHVAMYDDALLFRPEDVLLPFLEGVIAQRLPLSFYTPNALNVRLLTHEIARLMVRAGFRSFSLGFESESDRWMTKTGKKGSPDEFIAAVTYLQDAGAESVIAYIILGHPDAEEQEVEASMLLAHRSGARIMLSEFAPVPGTIDGERCRKWADLDEPLSHNKTAFTIRRLGADQANRLKALGRDLNSKLTSQKPPSGA